MSLTEGTTVTTPFPFPEWGNAASSRLTVGKELAALSNRARRTPKARKFRSYYDTFDRIPSAPSSALVLYGSLSYRCSYNPPPQPSSPAADDTVYADAFLAAYASILVDMGRAQARGDFTRPIGLCSDWAHRRTCIKSDYLSTVLGALSARVSAHHGTEYEPGEHGSLSLPQGFNQMSLTSTDRIKVGSTEWDALTQRRAELIFKKNRDGLSEDEKQEFARLQRLSRQATQATFPSGLSHIDEKLNALEKALAEKRGGTQQ